MHVDLSILLSSGTHRAAGKYALTDLWCCADAESSQACATQSDNESVEGSGS